MTTSLSARTERTTIIAIVALALALRVIAAITIPDQSQTLFDVSDYRDAAAQLLRNWQMAELYQMPLYPLLIAITGAGVGQLVADITLAVISVWLVYMLTDQIFGDQYARLLSATAAACYPPLIFFSVVGLSETLFIALILAAFLYWYRGQFTAAAIFAVLAVLTRPVFDIFAPVLVLMFALIVHRLPGKRALQHLGVYVIIYCVLMTPWWLNNYRLYGGFVRLTLGTGTALYAGNNPLNHSGGGILGVDYDTGAFTHIANPIERDRALRNAAVDYIVHNPKRFLELAALKFFRIWRVVPVNEAYRNTATVIISIAFFVPLLLLAGLGLFSERHLMRRLLPILIFALGYTGVHMILVGTIRYRLPLEPFLIVFAGAGASYLIRILPDMKRRSAS